MYFPSKKDGLFAVIIWGVIIFMAWQMVIDESVLLYIIGALTILLFLWLWFGTGYKIEKGMLKIKSGPFRSTVTIRDIKKLNATKSLLSAPALSIDRIEILHKKYDMTIVSPKNKRKFVSVLLTENNSIEVDHNLLE